MTKLGTIGFGGPVALVGYMNRDLVEERKWISESDYKEGLTLAQLMPGPLAAQLAIYLGYVHYGITGATLAGVAFVIPSFIMVVALGAAYVAYGGLTWMQAGVFRVGAAGGGHLRARADQPGGRCTAQGQRGGGGVVSPPPGGHSSQTRQALGL